MKSVILIILLSLSAKCHAQNWEVLPIDLNAEIKCLYADSVDDVMYMAGLFGLNGTDTVKGIAIWDNVSVQCVAEGLNNFYEGAYSIPVDQLARFQDKIYVSGGVTQFTVGDSILTRGIGVWDGFEWDSIHVGLVNASGNATGVAELKVINGKLYAGGSFEFIEDGQIPVNGLAKFDGTTWSAVHDFPKWGGSNAVRSIAEYNNEIYVAGNLYDTYPYDTMYNICRYNGIEWEQLGEGIGGGWSTVYDMQVYDGKLYVAGSFNKYERPQNPGNRIAVWNGESWEQVVNIQGTNESSYAYVRDMLVHNGELYVVGSFEKVNGHPANNFAKFDGTDWCVYEDDFDLWVHQVEAYNNEIYISGIFESINSVPVQRIAKLSSSATPIICESVIGLDEELNTEFSVSPNPFKDKLTLNLESSGQHQIYILDIQGRQVSYDMTSLNNFELNLSHLESGVYLVIVEVNGAFASRRIVKQ